MSVILFSRTDQFQKLADVYETIKPTLGIYWNRTDAEFYNALRRLYFANVATYLCQYHDHTPLLAGELAAIDPFQELKGTPNPNVTVLECAATFLSVWGSLKYNLTTNDGEVYEATESKLLMDGLATLICRVVL